MNNYIILNHKVMPNLRVKCVNSNKFEDKDIVRFSYYNEDGSDMDSSANISINILKEDPLFDKYIPGEVYDLTISTP